MRPVTAAELGTSSHRTVVDAFGVHVEVRVRGDRAAEVLDRLPRLWEFCAAPVGATGEVTAEVVFDSDPHAWAAADADGAVSRPDLEDLLQVLTQRITLSAIDARAGECLMLHAACIADPRDRCRRGVRGSRRHRQDDPGQHRWVPVAGTSPTRPRWCSDDRTVVPYPKPLSVRRTPDSLFKNETPPSAVGLAAPGARVHLAALCLLERDPTARGRAHRRDAAHPRRAGGAWCPRRRTCPRWHDHCSAWRRCASRSVGCIGSPIVSRPTWPGWWTSWWVGLREGALPAGCGPGRPGR